MDLVAGDSDNERPPPGPPADGPLRIFVVVASSSGKASCFDHQWPEGSPGRLEGAGDTIVGLALAKAWSFCRREEAAPDEVLETMRRRAVDSKQAVVKGFIEYPVDEYARLAEPVPVTVPLLAEVLLATMQPAGIVFRGSPGMAPATPQASTLADVLQRWAEHSTMGVARLVPRMADKILEGSCSSLHSVDRATDIIHL